jgi:hypothetical protein
MMRQAAILCYILILSTSVGIAQRQDTLLELPQVGDLAPSKPYNMFFWMDPDTTNGSCAVVVDGVRFYLYVRKNVIWQVMTNDSSFATLEGVQIGQSIQEVRAAGGEEPIYMPNLGFGSSLYSGWIASYRGSWIYPDGRIDSEQLIIAEDSVVVQLSRIK